MNDTYAAENMYDAWDNGDRHEIRQQFARREEIIRMAREAGLLAEDEAWVSPHQEAMERFAALVAAAEREACAKVCEEPGWNAANWCAKQIRARGD
jgi:hypothetical protein